MRAILICLLILGFSFSNNSLFSQVFYQPIVDEEVVFKEKDGVLAVEAEYFYKQTHTDVRRWYRISAEEQPVVGRDPDEAHVPGASNGTYLEILPDTRTNHGDKLIVGENFMNEPGQMAILYYKVHINNPGRYYIWVRTHSTNTEDNGVHVGIDGTWPEHGQRMQWTAKNKWFWDCKQRTAKVHIGVPMEIWLDIEKAGEHEIMFSMREDGFEFDKFMLVKDKEFRPEQDEGPAVVLKTGRLPKASEDMIYSERVAHSIAGTKLMKATDFPIDGTNYYVNDAWLAINPNNHKEAKTTLEFPFSNGTYDLVFLAVGENDGKSSFRVLVNDQEVGSFIAPLSETMFDEGVKYNDLWESIDLKKGDKITVEAKIGSKDGQEYSRGRWAGIAFAPATKGKDILEKMKADGVKAPQAVNQTIPSRINVAPRKAHGNGEISISGELKQWHKVNLTLDGPFADEKDNEPNPFQDYRMTVTFTHESGYPSYEVPGYFSADGNASESSATSGTKWRAHLSPDKAGKWDYKVSFVKGEMVAVTDIPWAAKLSPYDGKKGSFSISASDKKGRDFRAKGRLEYVGERYLKFKGTGEYFLKAGADAPETLLAYEDFDGTVAFKKNVPLKKYQSHLKDWQTGDPTWKNGKGKGLIGAINYLAGKGANAFSFLTYNAGGDGENVWPFIARDDKYHYDCSKLDQWQIVLDHAQSLGMYLHFKTQENENDDNTKGKDQNQVILESLDGGDLGPQRRLYYRELIARFGYLLALNWNLGEENTQTTEQQKAAAKYIQNLCPYPHNIVIHTFPNQQEKVYEPLLGKGTSFTGASLQNAWNAVHRRTLQWVKASKESGKIWVVANDEQGSAAQGVPPDPGYKGYKADEIGYDLHDVRKQVLWANLLAGGAGVEYYFGYKLPENDLVLEDFRSRDKTWDYCRIALNFFEDNEIPFWEMNNRNELIGNAENGKEKFCYAKEGNLYLVYLAYTEGSDLDLSGQTGNFSVRWLNPRVGGKLQMGKKKKVKGGKVVDLGKAPEKGGADWLVVIERMD